MKIKRYRTIACIYPHLSLEVETVLDDGETIYVNIDVNNKGEQTEILDDNHWAYTKPLDEADIDEDLVDADYNDVLEEMLRFWNSNPVFANDYEWKPFPVSPTVCKHCINGSCELSPEDPENCRCDRDLIDISICASIDGDAD